jgi:hypothetical protein
LNKSIEQVRIAGVLHTRTDSAMMMANWARDAKQKSKFFKHVTRPVIMNNCLLITSQHYSEMHDGITSNVMTNVLADKA